MGPIIDLCRSAPFSPKWALIWGFEPPVNKSGDVRSNPLRCGAFPVPGKPTGWEIFAGTPVFCHAVGGVSRQRQVRSSLHPPPVIPCKRIIFCTHICHGQNACGTGLFCAFNHWLLRREPKSSDEPRQSCQEFSVWPFPSSLRRQQPSESDAVAGRNCVGFRW